MRLPTHDICTTNAAPTRFSNPDSCVSSRSELRLTAVILKNLIIIYYTSQFNGRGKLAASESLRVKFPR